MDAAVAPAVASFRDVYRSELEAIRAAGLYKEERFIHDPQGAEIEVEFPAGAAPKRVLNLCANNYLGLSSHPRVVAAAHAGLEKRGYGMSSVRFICGTQDIHRDLERRLTAFLGTEEPLLFSSCLDANAGVFEALFGEKDVLVADRLVHASIVDGMRLSKAMTDTYKHSDMGHLEEKLLEHADKRFRVVITDGVFSMDGDLAKLDEIVALAEKHGALTFVDDSHATGFIGKTGRGTPEHFDVLGRVDLITTTFGKALGGASGGCVSGRKEIVGLLRQRSRPYLFSNSLAPVVAATTLAVLDLLEQERVAVRHRQALHLGEQAGHERAHVVEAQGLGRPGAADVGAAGHRGHAPGARCAKGHLEDSRRGADDGRSGGRRPGGESQQARRQRDRAHVSRRGAGREAPGTAGGGGSCTQERRRAVAAGRLCGGDDE